jgi:hypothetical protein
VTAEQIVAITGLDVANSISIGKIGGVSKIYSVGGFADLGVGYKVGGSEVISSTRVGDLVALKIDGTEVISSARAATLVSAALDTAAARKITITPVASPGAHTVAQHGTTGATTYGYKCASLLSDGTTSSEANAEVTIANGNATLSATDHIAITPPAVTGATLIAIYRTTGGATQGKIGTCAPGASFNDTGLAASGAAPTVNNTGVISGGRPLIQELTAPTLKGEMTFAYDSGTGKMKLYIFDGSNTFVFSSD